MNFLIESRVGVQIKCECKSARQHYTGILSIGLFSQQEGIECTAYRVKDAMV